MNKPKIVFVSTCKGRLAHLRDTLPKNIIDNRGYPNCVFVVLGYGDPEVGEYITSFHKGDLDSGRLVYYEFPTAEPFHVARAKNLAMRCAILEGADILVMVDADNGTGWGFAHF